MLWLAAAAALGAPLKGDASALQAASWSEALPTCTVPELPVGSHMILFHHAAPPAEGALSQIDRRMLGVADALTSQGVVVHMVFHAQYDQPPTTVPQQRSYRGNLWDQYGQAFRAAGDQLRLGMVFANAITTQLMGKLSNVTKARAKDLKAGESLIWTKEGLSELFRTDLFAHPWPEESAIKWLQADRVQAVVLTDDVHYLRAPMLLEASDGVGSLRCAPGCGSAVAEHLQRRELDLYASARLVFASSIEVRDHSSSRCL